MVQVGRRIIFDKVTGNVIASLGEMKGDVLPREDINELDYVDLEYGEEIENFKRAEEWHIDINTKKPVFTKLREKVLSPEERIIELENQLLYQEGVI